MAAKKKSKQLALWEQQMLADSKIASSREASSAGGGFISTRGGQLSYKDAPMPGNQMAVIILDTVNENAYYPGAFDPENPQPPECYALHHEEDEMVPHENAEDPQSQNCEACPLNEWGSADVGRGKACKNTRRLAVMPAGTFNRDDDLELFDADQLAEQEVAYMKLPVTSVKGYGSFVNQTANALGRPPYGVITRIYCEQDDKTQYKVLFEALDEADEDILPTIMEKREVAVQEIEFPYQPAEEPEAKPARKAAKRSTKKAPAKKVVKKAAKKVVKKSSKRKY